MLQNDNEQTARYLQNHYLKNLLTLFLNINRNPSHLPLCDKSIAMWYKVQQVRSYVKDDRLFPRQNVDSMSNVDLTIGFFKAILYAKAAGQIFTQKNGMLRTLFLKDRLLVIIIRFSLERGDSFRFF